MSANYGDKIMEGDHHVGQVLDVLKELKIEDNTIVVFASDNGPTGQYFANWGPLGTPDMGSPGPFRGSLGEATEGSIRTFAFVRWPGHVKPDSDSYAMFSVMDWLPTFANILNAKLPADQVIDGIDQTEVLSGASEMGKRDSLLTFIGPDLAAIRFKQWRIYLKDMNLTGTGQQQLGGLFINSADMFYPKVYNIEMDPHEDMDLGGYDLWAFGLAVAPVKEYLESLKTHPNPPPPNLTNFGHD